MSKTTFPIKVRLDESAAFFGPGAISPRQVEGLYPVLDQVRQRMLADAPTPAPSGSEPLSGAATLDWLRFPELQRLDYERRREQSDVGRILSLAEAWREQVDLVVVVGSGGLLASLRTLIAACCHPWHNEISRAERGSRPRIYLAGTNADNDWLHGLLDLLPPSHAGHAPVNGWGLVIVGQHDTSAEQLATAEILLRAVHRPEASPAMHEDVGPRLAWVAESGGVWEVLHQRTLDGEWFDLPSQLDGTYSVLATPGLMVAAILGLDVMRLLHGALAMNAHFAAAPPQDNLVLRLAALQELAEDSTAEHQAVRHVGGLRAWSTALEPLVAWQELLGRQGAWRSLSVQLVVDRWRCDPLPLDPLPLDRPPSSASLPELVHSLRQRPADIQPSARSGPSAEIFIPELNEQSLGEILQLLMLTAAVRNR